jgi:hypothetical protein
MPRRFSAMALGAFATGSLLLAAIGLYGLLVFNVRERVREIARRYSPVVVVASIDEMFLDLSGCERLYARPGDEGADVAIERVKQRVGTKQFQMFDLYVLKNWPVREVARRDDRRAGYRRNVCPGQPGAPTQWPA